MSDWSCLLSLMNTICSILCRGLLLKVATTFRYQYCNIDWCMVPIVFKWVSLWGIFHMIKKIGLWYNTMIPLISIVFGADFCFNFHPKKHHGTIEFHFYLHADTLGFNILTMQSYFPFLTNIFAVWIYHIIFLHTCRYFHSVRLWVLTSLRSGYLELTGNLLRSSLPSCRMLSVYVVYHSTHDSSFRR